MAEIFELTKLSYVVVIGAAFVNLMVGIIDPTVGPYLENLGTSYSVIGRVLAARFLVVAIGSIPFALLASKIGNFKVLLIPAIAAITGAYIINFIPGVKGVYYFYLVVGFADASASGPAAAILAENEGTKRIAAFSLFSVSWMLPPAIGSAISFYWFRNNSSFEASNIQTIFPVIGWIGVIGALIFLTLLIKYRKEDPVAEQSITLLQQVSIIFTPFVAFAVTLLIIVNFLGGAGAGATLPFLPIYLKLLGADARLTSLLIFILNLAMSLATQSVAPLAKRFGQVKVFAITQLLSIICLLAIVFTNDLVISSVFFILRGMFANMNTPITQALTFNYIDSKVRASASALITNIRWIGWTIASPISGKIIDTHGFKESFMFTAVIYLVSGILFIYVVLTKKTLVEYYEIQNKDKISAMYPTVDGATVSLAE